MYIYLRATPPAAGPLDVDSGLLTSVLAVGELGTYRPRFSSLRNVSENRVEINANAPLYLTCLWLKTHREKRTQTLYAPSKSTLIQD